VREAADLVGRSLSTVRAWVRSGRLEGHREEPGNKRSRLLVHRAALVAVAAELDPDGSHQTPAPAPTPATVEPSGVDGVEVARLRAELAAARELLTETRTRADTLAELLKREEDRTTEAVAEARRLAEAAEAAEARTAEAADAIRADLRDAIEAHIGNADAQRRRAEAAEAVGRDLRADLEAARAEVVGTRAELAALREREGLSWWHRLIGARPALPPPGEG